MGDEVLQCFFKAKIGASVYNGKLKAIKYVSIGPDFNMVAKSILSLLLTVSVESK